MMRLHLADDSAASVAVGERLVVVVDGVDNQTAIHAIRKDVREVLQRACVAGHWTVTIAPSNLSGRWDVTLKGPLKRHVFSLLMTEEKLPAVISDYVRRALERMRPIA
jgi:hypothetical protein